MSITFDDWAEAQAMNAKGVADYVNGLHRRIGMLERMIGDYIDPEACEDEADLAIVVAVLGRRNGPEQH